jgi:uncharacterized protein (DUF736 family)
MEKLGAMWKRLNKNKEPYLTGVIEVKGKKINIIVFKNGYKNTDNHPDYIIYEKEEEVKKPVIEKHEDYNEIPF